MNTWNPIESAPKDKIILLYRPTAHGCEKVSIGGYVHDLHAKKPKPYWALLLKLGYATGKEREMQSREWVPTHWMPLPEPPEDIK